MSGRRLAEAAAQAGITTVGDLLLRFPRGTVTAPWSSVSDLELKQQATIAVEVLSNAGRPFRRRGLSILSVKVGDDTDTVRATWFNQPWLAQKLTAGVPLLLTGSLDKRGFRVSEYEFLSSAGGVGEGGSRTARGLPAVPPSPRQDPRPRGWSLFIQRPSN